MNLKDRIYAFSELGLLIDEHLHKSENPEFIASINKAYRKNSWFIPEFIRESLFGISKFLTKESLEKWMSKYEICNSSKVVGIVMAGNIPLVGFHDFLSVLITGHKAKIKLSDKDDVLLPFICEKLIEIEPEFRHQIEFSYGILNDFEAIIATGSNNSSRYFEYYFKKVPHIIRKNRTSVAVFDGSETPVEKEAFINDLLLYFGMGCRNVSKIYIPEEYDICDLYKYIEPWEKLKNHNKFFNNYEYNRSIFLVNRIEHFDNGFLIFKEDNSIFSPISVLYFERFKDLNSVKEILEKSKENIQCIVSKRNIFYKFPVQFGDAQKPELTDYSDEIDTINFLINL